MPSSPPAIKRQPSLRDLAKELGVSHTTVALALKNDPRISFEVRKRVQTVANKRGYFINEIPRNLFGGRSNFIGLLVPNLQDSFYARLVEGIQEHLWNAEKIPLIFSTHGDVDREEAILERYARQRVDGVILVPTPVRKQHAHFAEVLTKSTPLVAVEHSTASLLLPQVRPDETMGILRATVSLLEAGCQRVVFCSSSFDEMQAVEMRRKGYEQVMDRAGLPRLSGHLSLRGFPHRRLLSELGQLVNASPHGKADAIVAASDDTAFKLIELLGEIGIRVPEDTFLTGFGNRGFHRNTPYDAPFLTTVDLQPERIGKEAALMVLNLREGTNMIEKDILVDPVLVQGRTTGLQTMPS